MTKQELAEKIYESSLIKGEFVLRSGLTSHEYFDKYRFEARPELLLAIAKMMEPMIPQDTDALAGLEMGGIPIATALSLQCKLPMVMVRKKAKTYGTCQFVEGMNVKGKKLLIIEDIISTGGQVKTSIKDLRKVGAIVDCALCVIDRSSTIHTTSSSTIHTTNSEVLDCINAKLYSLFTRNDFKD